jgi:hypothetical protein
MENTVKHFKDFKATDLTITGNKATKTMIIKFTNKCHIQTPWIKLNAYGVPKLSDYLKTELERAFIKVPLNDDEFKTKLLEVDMLMGSEGFKQEHLGPDYDKYTYVTLVKTPEDKQPYVKFKFDVSSEFDEFTINTQINKLTGVNREFCHCLCMDDVVRYVKFNSDIRLIITPVKLWIMKGNKTYGLTYKVNKIDVQATTQETIDFID